MKAFKLIFIFFVILFTLLTLAAFIFIKTFDINRYRHQIIAQASKTLNRKVDFERADLELSLKQGLTIKISELNIEPDPSFGPGKFLTVKEASCGVDLLGYIFKKEVNVSNIFIDSPQATIIRKKDGTLNLESIVQPTQATTEAAVSKHVPQALAFPALLISSLKVTNGTIEFVDRMFEPEVRLDISNFNLSVNNISLNKPFPFSVEGSVLSEEKNIKIEGKAQLDLKTQEVTILDLKGTTELSQFLLNEIPDTFPVLKDFNLPTELSGRLDIKLDKLIAGKEGLKELALNTSLTNGGMQFKGLALAIKNIVANLKITQAEILIENISANIGKGIMKGSGLVKDYLTTEDYNFVSNIENFNLEELTDQQRSKVRAEGIISGRMSFKGGGFKPQDITSNLSGRMDLSIVKVKLKNINILREVLDKISILPGLAEQFQEKLPERFKQKLAQSDTALTDTKLPIIIKNGSFIISNAAFGADEFMFRGQGGAGLNGTFSLQGNFFIPNDLSQSMVSVVDKLAYLLDEQGQIKIPLKVSGRTTDFKFIVDTGYIAEKLLVDQAKKQLRKVIDRALGIEEEIQVPQTTDGNIQQPQGAVKEEPKKNTTKEIIGGILRDIFE